jgi:phage protein D
VTLRGAQYEAISPTAIVTVLPKQGRRKPKRYLSERVIQVQYTDSGSRQSSGMKVDLRNDDQSLYYDKELMTKGTILGLSYGYPGLMVDAGQFTIKEPRGAGGVLSIEAKERKRGKMARKKMTRVWENVRRSDVAQQVLANHFNADEINVEQTPRVIESITQTGEHDWQFLWRQAQLASYEMYIDEKGVHFEKPKRKQRPSRLLRYIKNPIGLGEIMAEPEWEGTSAGIPGRIKVVGSDARRKRGFTVVVDKTSAEDYDELEETLGADDPTEGDTEDRGDTGHELLINAGHRTEEEAREFANALYKTARYGALKATLQIIGDPTVRSRRIVAIWGIGPTFDGLWWVKSVEGTIGQGFEQRLQITREGLAKKLNVKRSSKAHSIGSVVAPIAASAAGALHRWF